jgi:hypothetical protein
MITNSATSQKLRKKETQPKKKNQDLMYRRVEINVFFCGKFPQEDLLKFHLTFFKFLKEKINK